MSRGNQNDFIYVDEHKHSQSSFTKYCGVRKVKAKAANASSLSLSLRLGSIFISPCESSAQTQPIFGAAAVSFICLPLSPPSFPLLLILPQSVIRLPQQRPAYGRQRSDHYGPWDPETEGLYFYFILFFSANTGSGSPNLSLNSPPRGAAAVERCRDLSYNNSLNPRGKA